MLMFDAPKTKEEAKKRKYGRHNNRVFVPNRCAFEVFHGWSYSQCRRKPGHGPDQLYCKQHSKYFDKGE